MGYPSLGGGKKGSVQEALLEEAVSDPVKGWSEWHVKEEGQEYKVTLYNPGKVGLPSWPGVSRVGPSIPSPCTTGCLTRAPSLGRLRWFSHLWPSSLAQPDHNFLSFSFRG